MSSDNASISPEEFVQEFRNLKDNLVQSYFSNKAGVSRVKMLSDAGIAKEQLVVVKCVVDEALTGALYTVLLALEGCASISQHQIMYKLFDEGSNELTGSLETLAWKKLHGQNA